MTVKQELLDILVCPEDKSELHFADDSLITNLNQQIEAETLKNRKGETVSEKMQAGLIRKDGKFLYPIRDDIPVMLIDESIPIQ